VIGDPVHPRPLQAPRVSVVAVDHDDPAAGALRAGMAGEIEHRYVDRLGELVAHAAAGGKSCQ
jgi:hypothetical protein